MNGQGLELSLMKARATKATATAKWDSETGCSVSVENLFADGLGIRGGRGKWDNMAIDEGRWQLLLWAPGVQSWGPCKGNRPQRRRVMEQGVCGAPPPALVPWDGDVPACSAPGTSQLLCEAGQAQGTCQSVPALTAVASARGALGWLWLRGCPCVRAAISRMGRLLEVHRRRSSLSPGLGRMEGIFARLRGTLRWPVARGVQTKGGAASSVSTDLVDWILLLSVHRWCLLHLLIYCASRTRKGQQQPLFC